MCVSRQISYDARAVDWIYKNFYGRLSIHPRACHPRDVVDHLCDFARFTDAEPVLSEPLLQGACASYFLDMPDSGGEEGATVVAADANADEQPDPDPEALASALARGPEEVAPSVPAPGAPRETAGL